MVRRYVSTKIILVRNKDKPWFDDQCNRAFGLKQDAHLQYNRSVIALGLTGKSLSVVKWEPIKPSRRTRVSLVLETGMFLWIPSPLISGGPLLGLPCLARVGLCLRWLLVVLDCCRNLHYRRTFIPFSVLCETILLTLYSMVWEWWDLKTGPITFYGPCYTIPFCLILFSLSLLSFYGLVLWGCGLWTDRVLIALSQPCTANLFLIIRIIIIYNGKLRGIQEEQQ